MQFLVKGYYINSILNTKTQSLLNTTFIENIYRGREYRDQICNCKLEDMNEAVTIRKRENSESAPERCKKVTHDLFSPPLV